MKLRKLAASIATVSLVTMGAIVLPALSASAETVGDVCLADDGAPNIYVGGVLTSNGYGEVGSPVVVDGDASFGSEKFGIGAASGSQTWPAAGETVLRVGGDFTGTVDARGDVAAKANVKARVGGTISGNITTAESVESELGREAALGSFANWQQDGVVGKVAHSYLNAGATAGQVDASGSGLTFTGSNAERQLFTVDASEFDGSALAVAFDKVAKSKLIVVKVTGDAPNIYLQSLWTDNAQPDLGHSNGFESLANRLVWVFPDATAITFSGDNPGQFAGSVLAPKADVDVTMYSGGLNGRLWVGGDVTFKPGSNGWEIHLFGSFSCPNPDTPDGPDTPANPDTPDGPDTPANPDTPDGPDTPANPESTVVTPALESTQCFLVDDVSEVDVQPVAVDGIEYTIDDNKTESVTITATAQDGYELTVPAGWTGDAESASQVITIDDVICVGGESATQTPPTSHDAAPKQQASVEVKAGHADQANGAGHGAQAEVVRTLSNTGIKTATMGIIALVLLAGGAFCLALGSKTRRARRQY